MSELTGKTAIVTGAATGVGEGIAVKLAELGANVVIAGKNEAAGQSIATRLDPSGERIIAIKTDVRNPNDVCAMVEETVKRFGALNLAVNNAGVTGPHNTKLEDLSVEDWDNVINTDLSGVFYCMKYEIPALVKANGGSIVNLSSANGVVGAPGLSAYTAAKHGIIGLTKTAAIDYAKQNIRVNAIGPGLVSTERVLAAPPGMLDSIVNAQPVNRMVTPEEVAELVAFLLSDRSKMMTGGFYPIDGGYTAQ